MTREELISQIQEREKELLASYPGTPHYRDVLKHMYRLNEKLMHTKSTLKSGKKYEKGWSKNGRPNNK